MWLPPEWLCWVLVLGGTIAFCVWMIHLNIDAQDGGE